MLISRGASAAALVFGSWLRAITLHVARGRKAPRGTVVIWWFGTSLQVIILGHSFCVWLGALPVLWMHPQVVDMMVTLSVPAGLFVSPFGFMTALELIIFPSPSVSSSWSHSLKGYCILSITWESMHGCRLCKNNDLKVGFKSSKCGAFLPWKRACLKC